MERRPRSVISFHSSAASLQLVTIALSLVAEG